MRRFDARLREKRASYEDNPLLRRGLSSRPISNFSVPFEDLFGKQPAGGKILREEMNEASILAKNVPFLPAELLRELKKL
jgi:hypothetical protein